MIQEGNRELSKVEEYRMLEEAASAEPPHPDHPDYAVRMTNWRYALIRRNSLVKQMTNAELMEAGLLAPPKEEPPVEVSGWRKLLAGLIPLRGGLER